MKDATLSEVPVPFQRHNAMTNLAKAAAKQLEERGHGVVSDFQLFQIIWKIYKTRSTKYLRGAKPSPEAFSRTKALLREEGLIRADKEYQSYWRVMSLPDAPADTVICEVDPYCYISHLSGMQAYGLTNRRPAALFITSPSDAIAREWNKQFIREQFGDETDAETFIEKFRVTHHPEKVRGRLIDQLKTKFYGRWQIVRGTSQRIASIEQIFLDMLDAPQRCGGMRHILEIWSKSAESYLPNIIRAIDQDSRQIIKVRAGYIIDEHLGIRNATVQSWLQNAQRGGSRVLEVGREFKEPFSERWMISVDVG